MLKRIALSLVLATAVSGPAMADAAQGVWVTGPDRKGQVGHVRFSRCGEALCGKVLKAFDKSGNSVKTKNVGKRVIWGMKPTGNGNYAGNMYVSMLDKNVKGTFRVSGQSMTVRGCYGPLCSSQVWKKID